MVSMYVQNYIPSRTVYIKAQHNQLIEAASMLCQRKKLGDSNGEDSERGQFVPQAYKSFVVCVSKCKPQYQKLSWASTSIKEVLGGSVIVSSDRPQHLMEGNEKADLVSCCA